MQKRVACFGQSLGSRRLSPEWRKGKELLLIFTLSFGHSLNGVSVTTPGGHAKPACDKMGAVKSEKDRTLTRGRGDKNAYLAKIGEGR